ncbi:hypothetical protein BJV77DRAFT_1067760 [Russula vinacea]|nr:hypothetical protein BJV77DRAFT_1067760 [Russula vinacea]
MLEERFDVYVSQSYQHIILQSSASEIEVWTSSSPASARDLEQSGTHQDDGTEAPQHKLHMSGRRTASPFCWADPLAPMSKYKVGSAADHDEDDPFCVTASSSAPKETGTEMLTRARA